MAQRLHYEMGDHITLKKGHPCGANHWEIQRIGVDMKLACQGCGKVVWLSRIDFEKRVRKIRVGEKWIAIVHHHPAPAEEGKEEN